MKKKENFKINGQGFNIIQHYEVLMSSNFLYELIHSRKLLQLNALSVWKNSLQGDQWHCDILKTNRPRIVWLNSHRIIMTKRQYIG